MLFVLTAQRHKLYALVLPVARRQYAPWRGNIEFMSK